MRFELSDPNAIDTCGTFVIRHRLTREPHAATHRRSLISPLFWSHSSFVCRRVSCQSRPRRKSSQSFAPARPHRYRRTAKFCIHRRAGYSRRLLAAIIVLPFSPYWQLHMASADFCIDFATPLDVRVTAVTLGTDAARPGYYVPPARFIALTFMPWRSVHVSVFNIICRRTHR